MPDEPLMNVSYGPVRLVAAGEPEAPVRVPLHQRIGDGLTFLRSVVVNLAVIAAVAALVALTVTELRRQPVIIEEIGLPPQLAARGYTGAVAAHRLWDAITEIQSEAGTLKRQAALTTLSRQLDVVEPGTGLSLQGLTQMLRALLGLPQTRIAGEVICETRSCGWAGLRMRLRIFTSDGMEVRSLGLVGGRGTRDYFHRAAVEAMKVVDPYSLASYYYDRDRPLSLRMADELVATSHRHRAWAANLLGNAEQEGGRYEDSMVWFTRSLEFADSDDLRRFALPWNGWGNSLSELGRHEEAIQKYRHAIKLNPTFADPWNGWGNRLNEAGLYEEAIEKYRRAIELDPNYSYAWNGWGNGLGGLGRPGEAIEKYRRATELDPNLPHPWSGWGNGLGGLDRHEEAFAQYAQALAIDPEYQLAARNWGFYLTQHLDAAPDLRCERASAHGPAFLETAGPLLDGDWRRDEVLAALDECGVEWAAAESD